MMFKKITNRFSGKKKTGAKRKAPLHPEIDPSVVPEVPHPVQQYSDEEDIVTAYYPSNYTKVEDDEPHARKSISTSDQNFRYTHRGSLYNLIGVYNAVSTHSPAVKYIIDKSGWGRLLSMEIGESTRALVDYLVECWWDSTHTFHFPFGEMGITPLDWAMLTGMSIGDGGYIPYNASLYTFEYVKANIFPELLDPSVCAQQKVPPHWTSDAITVSFLGKYFTEETLIASRSDGTLTEKLAKAFFMFALGQFFFSNARNYIAAGWLAAFEDFDAVDKYDWGGAAFAYLYMSLNNSCRLQKSLNGPFAILEFWGYEYLGICRPHVPEEQTAFDRPRCSRWKPKRKRNVDILRPRALLAELTERDVTWMPWESARGLLENTRDLRLAEDLSKKRVIFNYFDTNLLYVGERCWRQMNDEYGFPVNPPEQMTGISDEVREKLKNDGWPESHVFVQVATYEVYLQLWRHVTNFATFQATVDWKVDVYTDSGELFSLTVDKPPVHVPIPPQQELSYAQSYTMNQDYADLCGQLRHLTTSATKERSQSLAMLVTKDAQIAALTKQNSELADQVRHFEGRLEQPQGSLGYGSFSGSVPRDIWATLGTTVNPTGPTPPRRSSFQRPRYNKLEYPNN